jgi:hypothetical protein
MQASRPVAHDMLGHKGLHGMFHVLGQLLGCGVVDAVMMLLLSASCLVIRFQLNLRTRLHQEYMVCCGVLGSAGTQGVLCTAT